MVARDVHFTVSSTRMMRVYVEQHEVDIDVGIYVGANRVASGTNYVGTEESFTYILSPNIDYIFRVSFWLWDSSLRTKCNNYSILSS